MNCPKCPGKLKKELIENVPIDYCWVCEGIWFDRDELEQVIQKDSRDFDFIDLGRKNFDGKEIKDLEKNLDIKEGTCPKCADGTLLVRKEYKDNKDVNVDVCPKCLGVWLDGGEILRLRKRFLVDIKGRLDCCMQFLKLYFSKEGKKQMDAWIKENKNGYK